MHMRLRVCLSTSLPRVGGHDAREREGALLLLEGGRGWALLGITELRLLYSLVLLGRLGRVPSTSGTRRLRRDAHLGVRSSVGPPSL